MSDAILWLNVTYYDISLMLFAVQMFDVCSWEIRIMRNVYCILLITITIPITIAITIKNRTTYMSPCVSNSFTSNKN